MRIREQLLNTTCTSTQRRRLGYTFLCSYPAQMFNLTDRGSQHVSLTVANPILLPEIMQLLPREIRQCTRPHSLLQSSKAAPHHTALEAPGSRSRSTSDLDRCSESLHLALRICRFGPPIRQCWRTERQLKIFRATIVRSHQVFVSALILQDRIPSKMPSAIQLNTV